MAINTQLLTNPGPCPACGRPVRDLAGVLHNVQTGYVAIHTDYLGRPATAAHLASNILNSTAADLRCLLGACRATGA